MRRGGSAAIAPPLLLASFVLLGLPAGSLGVLWPSMQSSFGLPLSGLGALLLAATAGYLVAAAASGPIGGRLGSGWMLLLASATAGLALLAAGLAPVWPLLIAAYVVEGAAGGVVDGGVNTYAALRHGPALMNLLHAAYGVGTFGGPLLVLGVFLAGSPWRGAYVVLALLQAAMLLSMWLTGAWAAPAPATRRPGSAEALPEPPRWRLTLTFSALLFFVYTGIEVAAGQWAYSYLLGRHLAGAAAAALVVSAYWGALTAGRLAAAGAAARLSARAILTSSLVITLAGAAAFWWSPAAWTPAVALPVVGFGLAAT